MKLCTWVPFLSLRYQPECRGIFLRNSFKPLPTRAVGLPRFIIGGAPKTGTTSLFRYLGQHPEVFTSNPKEPHYLASEDGTHIVCGSRFTREEYEGLFEGAHSNQVAGEASTWYLRLAQRVAPKAAEMIPKAKWIFLLRDPVDRAYSDYWFHIFRGNLSSEDNSQSTKPTTGFLTQATISTV